MWRVCLLAWTEVVVTAGVDLLETGTTHHMLWELLYEVVEFGWGGAPNSIGRSCCCFVDGDGSSAGRPVAVRR